MSPYDALTCRTALSLMRLDRDAQSGHHDTEDRQHALGTSASYWPSSRVTTTLVGIRAHRSHPFPDAGSRSRSIARGVPAGISTGHSGTVVATVASLPPASVWVTGYRRCEPTSRTF
jgi:hypothetical protein